MNANTHASRQWRQQSSKHALVAILLGALETTPDGVLALLEMDVPAYIANRIISSPDNEAGLLLGDLVYVALSDKQAKP